MLGLSPREARRRADGIIDFAGLEEFTELKLKNYSSGMLVRLAFSVMIQVDADVLLIDEVLAVGDAAFQQKCYEEFERIRSSGATVLLVTHDMSAVQRFCDRALLLEHGRAVELGDPEHVGNRYLELNFSEQARAEEETAAKADEAAAQAEETAAAREESAARVERTGIAAANAGSEQTAVPDEQVDAEVEGTRESALPATAARRDTDTTGAATDRSPDSAKRYGDGRAEIREAWFEDEHGERAEVLHTGRACAFAARVLFYDDVDDPLFGVVLHNSRRVNVLGATNQWTNEHTGIHHAGDQLVFRIGFDNFLAPDRYYATPAVAHRGMGAAWIDRRERFVDVVVTGIIATDATVLIPFKFAIDGEDSIAVARER
jgi:ABC-type lipoprotein export system ATPase subunit